MIKQFSERVFYTKLDDMYYGVLIPIERTAIEKLFGDNIVKTAYIVYQFIFNHEIKEKSIEDVIGSRHSLYEAYVNSTDDSIDLEHGLIMELTSGKTVTINVSEWGWLEPFGIANKKSFI